MAYHKFVTNCRNPHKGLRYDTSARALYKSHRSCFEPNIPNRELTERQQAIYDGVFPDPTKRDIVVLIKKFEYYGRYDDVEKIYDMYGYFFHEIHEGDPSLEEAIAILDELTPDDLK